jgi:hypothetical protein
LTPLPADGGAGEGTAATRHVSLAPGATEVVSIDDLPWSGPFRARIAPDDDLPLDDTVYGFVPAAAPLHVLLVSEDDALEHALEGLARSLGNVSVRTLPPARYQPGNAAGITIFDRFAPTLPPSGNVVYLAPARGNADVTVAGEEPHARFAEQRAHPLVDGVADADTLLGEGMVKIASTGALKPVLLGRAEGREVPLLLAGEVGGRRIVATSFPLRAADLRNADALPTLVFTINLLRWLSPAVADAPLMRLAGERLRAGSPDAAPIARLSGPGGTRELAPAEEVTLEHAGVYQAIGAAGTRELLVSFVDPVESDIARPATLPAPAPARTAEPARSPESLWQKLPYVREVLLVAIAVMLLEWLVVAATGPRARRGAAPADAALGAGGRP